MSPVDPESTRERDLAVLAAFARLDVDRPSFATDVHESKFGYFLNTKTAECHQGDFDPDIDFRYGLQKTYHLICGGNPYGDLLILEDWNRFVVPCDTENSFVEIANRGDMLIDGIALQDEGCIRGQYEM